MCVALKLRPWGSLFKLGIRKDALNQDLNGLFVAWAKQLGFCSNIVCFSIVFNPENWDFHSKHLDTFKIEQRSKRVHTLHVRVGYMPRVDVWRHLPDSLGAQYMCIRNAPLAPGDSCNGLHDIAS